MTKYAAYESAVTAGLRAAREQIIRLNEVVEKDRHRIANADEKMCEHSTGTNPGLVTKDKKVQEAK